MLSHRQLVHDPVLLTTLNPPLAGHPAIWWELVPAPDPPLLRVLFLGQLVTVPLPLGDGGLAIVILSVPLHPPSLPLLSYPCPKEQTLPLLAESPRYSDPPSPDSTPGSGLIPQRSNGGPEKGTIGSSFPLSTISRTQ